MGKNWIQRKNEREDQVKRDAPQLWMHLQAAVEDALESFSKLYPDRPQPTSKRISDRHFEVILRDRNATLDLKFDEKQNVVNFILGSQGTQHEGEIGITIGQDGKTVFVLGGKELSADGVSEDLLKDVLFAD
jgi:hypothetical protein